VAIHVLAPATQTIPRRVAVRMRDHTIERRRHATDGDRGIGEA
jgi:hypothetical protein